MKKSMRRLLCGLMLLALITGTLPAVAVDEPNFCYNYVLIPLTDGVSDGKVVLDLYVAVNNKSGSANPSSPAGPILDAGAFGLRFPKWVEKIEFVPSEDVTLQRVVSKERYDYAPGSMEIVKDSYHSFAWTGKMAGGSTGEIQDRWMFQDGMGIGGFCLKIGRYTLTLPAASADSYRLPGRTDVGQLDWLSVDESIAKEVGGTAPDGTDPLNVTIWNPETELYQGYYAPGVPSDAQDALLTQTDIGFRFTPPSTWPNAFTLLSYDPKKPITIKLFDKDKAELSSVQLDVWTAESGDTGEIYAATAANTGLGTGPYFHAVDLDTLAAGQTIAVGETYYLVISKPGHLTQTLQLVTKSAGLSGAEGLPAEDAWLYLPAGDLNHNGRIDMAVRAILLRQLGASVGGEGLASYRADLDGDGRVTMADLSILMSPILNYTKQAKEGK